MLYYFSHSKTSSDNDTLTAPSGSGQLLFSLCVGAGDTTQHTLRYDLLISVFECEAEMAGNCFCSEDSLKKILLQACETQNLERVKACLTLNVDVNYQARSRDIDVREGDTALHVAVHKGDQEVVKLLTEHPRINVNLENKDGERPIVILFRNTYFNINILQLLLEVPSLQLDFESGGQHFSHLICEFNPQSLAIISKDARFKINALNDEGDTPIAVAVKRNDWKMFNLLFNHPEVDKSVLSPILVTAMEQGINNGLGMQSIQMEMENTTLWNGQMIIRRTRMTPSRDVDLNNNNEKMFRIISEHFYRMSAGRNTQSGGGRYSPIHIDFVDIVSNPSLESMFNRKQEEFTSKGIPNKVIFAYHGTKTSSINNIIENNFDLSKARRSQHGVGNYFSEYPDVALQYSDQRNKIILCKLLPGRQYRGYNCDWPYHDSKLVNPSMTSGNQSQNNISEMVIIKNSRQILPFCIIHLK